MAPRARAHACALSSRAEHPPYVRDGHRRLVLELGGRAYAPEPRPVVPERLPAVGLRVVPERGEGLERAEDHAPGAETALHPSPQVRVLLARGEPGEPLRLQIEEVRAVLDDAQHQPRLAL